MPTQPGWHPLPNTAQTASWALPTQLSPPTSFMIVFTHTRSKLPACCSAQKPHVPTVVEACSEGGGGYAFTSYQRKHWEVREAWLTILGYMLLMQKACWSERSICLGICISCHGEVILLLGTLSHPPHHKDPTQIDQKCCRHAKQSIKAGQQAGSPRNENAACRPRMKVGAQRTWAYDSPGASSGTPVR